MGKQDDSNAKKVVRFLSVPPSQRPGFPWSRSESFTEKSLLERLGPEFSKGTIVFFERQERQTVSTNKHSDDQSVLKTLETVHFVVADFILDEKQRTEALRRIIAEDYQHMQEKMVDFKKSNGANPYSVYYFASKDSCWRHGMYPMSQRQLADLSLPVLSGGDALQKII